MLALRLNYSRPGVPKFRYLDVVFNALERILLPVEFRVMISHNLQRCFEV
jgi:hypothetical protein